MVLLINILAADEKYPVLNRDNLTITIQMQLSQKQKTFSRFFSAFLKSKLNFKHFEKKMTRIAFVFRKLRTPKTKLDKCQKKLSFRGPFDKQHGRRDQALLKYALQHLYVIH